MRVILEGPDGVGKTTLAKKIAEHFNCDILSMTEYGAKEYNDYRTKCELDQIVSDRSFLSEVVYSIVFNRKSKVNAYDCHALMTKYRNKGWKIIILDGDTTFVQNRLMKRGNEDSYKVENIDNLRQTYKTFARFYELPIFDIEKTSAEDIIKYLEVNK